MDSIAVAMFRKVLAAACLVALAVPPCACPRDVSARVDDAPRAASATGMIVVTLATDDSPAMAQPFSGPPPLQLEPGGKVPGGVSLTIPDAEDGFAPGVPEGVLDRCGDQVLEDASIKGPTQLLAVSPSGEELWRLTEPEAGWYSLPVATDSGGVLICSRERYVYSISSAGELQWTYEARHPDDWLYWDEGMVQRNDEAANSYRDERMAQPGFWNDGLPSDLLALPVLGGAYVATAMELVRLDAAGQVIWRFELPQFENAVLLIDDNGQLYLFSELEDPVLRDRERQMRKDASPEERNRLRQFNRVTLTAITIDGTRSWSYSFMAEPLHITPLLFDGQQPCAIAAGQAYLYIDEHTIAVVDEQGREAWRFELPLPASAEPNPAGLIPNWIYGMTVGKDGSLFLQSNRNVVFALNADGSIRYQSAAPKESAAFPDSWVSIMTSLASDASGNLYGLSDEASDHVVLWALDNGGKELWSHMLESDYPPVGPVVTADGTVMVELSSMEMNSSGRRRWGNRLQCYWPNGELCYERYFRAQKYSSFPPLFAGGSHSFSLVYGKCGGQLMLLPETEAIWKCDGEQTTVLPSSLVQLSGGALVFYTGDAKWVVSHCG